jgi:hypothetical protein
MFDLSRKNIDWNVLSWILGSNVGYFYLSRWILQAIYPLLYDQYCLNEK